MISSAFRVCATAAIARAGGSPMISVSQFTPARSAPDSCSMRPTRSSRAVQRGVEEQLVVGSTEIIGGNRVGVDDVDLAVFAGALGGAGERGARCG